MTDAVDDRCGGERGGDAGVAFVRCVEGEEHVQLRLRLGGEPRSFFRPAGERLDKIRYRLQLLASGGDGRGATAKKKKKKTREKKKEEEEAKEKGGDGSSQPSSVDQGGGDANGGVKRSVAVRFLDEDGAEVDGRATSIRDALMRTARITVGDEELFVVRNQPVVNRLSAIDPLLPGIPVIPIAQTECCSPDDCSWRWFRLEKDTVDQMHGGGQCCSSRSYTPCSADVGSRFRIECRAPAAPSEYAKESLASLVTGAVIPSPERSSDTFRKRRELGETRAAVQHSRDDAFRVMSYNVLFDGYTTSTHAKRNLFPYASPAVMQEMYRAQLVFQEIGESNADVVCLQEVGQQVFSVFFEPMMKAIGFHAFYSAKTGTTQEGCATFVRLAALRVVKEYTLDISGATKNAPDPSVQALLHNFPEIAKGVGRAPSIAQILELEPSADVNNGRRVFVSNTHLFYREDAHFLRFVQTIALVRELQRLHQEAEQTGLTPAVVMCGDFNAFPWTIPVEFLLHGVVDSNHPHWKAAPSFVWARTSSSGNERGTSDHSLVSAGRIEHPFHLVSGCGIPEFTNFAGHFVGTLDFIFVDKDQLEVCGVFPLFSTAEAAEEVALPSSKLPSDHVAIICDLAWRQ